MCKTKLKLKILFISSLAAFLIGCSTGGNGVSQPTPKVSVIQDGPLNYAALVLALDSKASSQTNTQASVVGVESDNIKVSMLKTGASNGTAGADAGTALEVTGGVVGIFCPVAGAAIGAVGDVVDLIGGNNGSAYLQSQIDDINQTLAYQQGEINSLQIQINTNNAYYNAFVKQTTGSAACQSMQQYYQTVNMVYVSGLTLPTGNSCLSGVNLPNTTNSIGNQFQSTIKKSGENNITLTATNNTTMQNIISLANKNNYSNGSGASNSNFQSYVDNLSISQLNSSTWSYPSLGSSVDFSNITSGAIIQSQSLAPSSTACASTNVSNSTGMLLACGYQYFLANMLPIPGTQSSNVVTSINQYNQTLLQIYEQNVLSLQYAYNIEATSNYMNFINYTNCLNQNNNNGSACTANQIPSWYGLLETTFSVGSNSSNSITPSTITGSTLSSSAQLTTQYFTTAQQNLLLAYAKRVNTLYKNLMNFIISDPQMSTQSYISQPSPQTYYIYGQNIAVSFKPQNSLYTTIAAATLKSSTNGGQIPGSQLSSLGGGILYQYSGINQLYSCVGPSNITPSSSTAKASINLNNCVSAFPSSVNGYYDGVSMQAYGSALGYASATIQTNMLNMSESCVPNSLTIQAPTVFNGSVLQCNYYGGTNYANQWVFPGTISQPNMGSGTFSLTALPFINTNGQYGISASNGASALYLLASSTGGGYTYSCNTGGGANFWNTNNSNISPYAPCAAPVYDSGFGSKPGEINNNYNTALMQVTLPNGYVAPFYIVTQPAYSKSNTQTYLGIYCPATQPTGGGCSYNNMCLLEGTQDGGQYNICLSSSSNSNTLNVGVTTVQAPQPPSPIGAMPTGSYTQSCIKITWNSPVLSAECNAGGYVPTSLNYSTCVPGSTVSNINGILTCDILANPIPSGSYTQSCVRSSISWNYPMLSADCSSSAYGYTINSNPLNYSTCAPNSTVSVSQYGVLVCDTLPANGAPTGSYTQICNNIFWTSPMLSASCINGTTPGGYTTSTLNYSTCASGSGVNDMYGVLTCATLGN
ncbi:MAG: hypothetical protein RL154_284 [Pseudomonadota bacterium]|jgi:hypothetical protein